MRALLWLFAIGCIAAGLTHVVLGPGADALLGATIGPETLHDPTLDSQNRFYGASFTLYGILTMLSLGNLERYAPVLQWTMLVFLFGGIARGLAWATTGAPSAPTIALLASELLLPPLVLWWTARRTAENPRR